MHRLPALDDRRAVGGTINLTPEQSELVVSFPPGVAAAAVDGMDRPVMLQVPAGEQAEDESLAVKDPPLQGSRSGLCDLDCHDRPCTLQMIDDAEHRSRDPLVIVWVEAVVTSYVIGRPPPVPSAKTLRALADLASERTDCVLIHAVERAITARRSWLAPWLDPDDFAEHVIAVIRDLAGGKSVAEESDWLRWTAGWYRWQDVRSALNRAINHGDGDGPPHPSTLEWEKRGIRLESPTVSGQLAELKAHPSYLDGQEQIAVGDLETSQLVWAVRQTTGALTRQSLESALRSSGTGPSLPIIVSQVAHLVCPDDWSHAEGP